MKISHTLPKLDYFFIVTEHLTKFARLNIAIIELAHISLEHDTMNTMVFLCLHFRVDPLYAFFVQWSPNIYGGDDEIDPTERGFVMINDDEEEEELDESGLPSLRRQMSKDWEVRLIKAVVVYLY